METRARYVTIGFFTLLVTVLAFGFIYWLKRMDETGARIPLQLEFANTVNGLAPGGWVYFAGIKVGSVTALAFDADRPNTVLVTAEVKGDTPIKADSRAQVGANLLTGVAYVELFGGSPDAKSVFDLKPPKLVGSPSGFSDVVATANKVVSRVDTMVERVDKFIATNEGSVTETVDNINKFTDALAKNSDGVKDFLANVSEMSKTVSGLSERLNALVEKADKIVASVDAEKVRTAVDNASQFVEKINKASDGVEGVVGDVKKVVADISEFSGGLKKTLADIQGFVDGIDKAKITAAIDNVTGFTDRLKAAGPDIDSVIADAKATAASANEFTANLNTRKDDLNQIVTDIKKVTSDVSGVSGGFKTTFDEVQKFVASIDQTKVANTIDNVSGFTDKLKAASPDIDSFIADAKATAKSANEFTANLNTRKDDLNQIVTDIKKVTADVSGVSGGFKTTLDDIQKFVASIDPTKVANTIDNVSGFTDKLQAASPDIDSLIANAKATAANANEFTANLNARKEDLNKIVTDAKQLAERLNTSSEKLNSILAKTDDMVNTKDGKNLFETVSKAADAIRVAAETITARADQVSVGLTKFSDRGLDNISQLVNELRASVSRIDRAVGQISSDPSSIVFGGNSGVREYNRR